MWVADQPRSAVCFSTDFYLVGCCCWQRLLTPCSIGEGAIHRRNVIQHHEQVLCPRRAPDPECAARRPARAATAAAAAATAEATTTAAAR